jgi:hypothetical protein
MSDFPSSADFLADARRDFPEFYRLATPADTGLMDGLVIMHAALVVGLNTSREGLDTGDRREVERATQEAEQQFTGLRERVRACPTFQRISDGERNAIERIAFKVRVTES